MPELVEPGAAVFGYTSRFSFVPGERVPVHVSCEEVGHYTAELVRLRHGYEGPAGPGLREQRVERVPSSEHDGAFHAPNVGSYVTVADPDGRIARLTSWALALQFLATTPAKAGVQCLAGAWDDAARAGVAIVVVDGRVALRLGDGTGDPELLRCAPAVEAGTWYRVDAAYDDATREARIALAPSSPPVNAAILAAASTARGDEHRRALAGAPAWPSVPFAIGAASTGRPGFPECVEHFNGKVDRPRLWADADATDLVADWHLGRSNQPDGTLLDGVVDVSGSGLHGVCVNCPTRGVTGPAWSGREPNFRHAPDEYASIHFHDDDLDDALWPEAFGVDLPADLASGVYAVRLDGGVTTGYVPFAVRPRPDGPRAEAALLLPTGSYLAYANDRLSFDVAGTELLIGHTPVVSEFDLQLQRHYDFSGSNYEVHSDGSGFLYSSRRRPIITMDPRYRAWVALDSVWQFPADLCIVDWLDEIGVAFDVITDEDLHREGADLLRPYRVVMTGSHPEYVSEPELDAVEEYVSDGGRLMYLGGNGFYWIVSYHPQKPYVMEVRRSEAGTRPHQAPAGEYYLATNGRLGALWRNKGRPPQRLLGVGFTAQGFDRCSPYLRMPDSHDPRAAFIFDGVGGDEVIGAFGIVGSGAAGAEVDRYDLTLGTPPDALLVATSTPLSDNYNHCSEEIFETPPGIRGSEDPDVRSDLVYFCLDGGGAVFSVGSIAWTGALSHAGYDNNVARITGNVLRRFLDAAPLAW